MIPGDSTIPAAYAACRRLARRHYENFPVASYLVPKDKRDALAAIYAFARTADDFADEPPVAEAAACESPLERLAAWRRKLNEAYAGKAHDPVFIALSHTVQKFELSQQHFENLLRAFELDLTTSRHTTFSSLLDYCTCSANPVGRLVLELFGHRDPELFALSDRLCTGLQLANFWQDVGVDSSRGQVYLPLEDLDRFRYSVSDLLAQQVDDRWTRLMAFEVRRTRDLFERSRLLSENVLPSLRRQLRLTWLGGMAILRKIEAVGYDVFRRRPTLSGWDFLRLWLRARRAL